MKKMCMILCFRVNFKHKNTWERVCCSGMCMGFIKLHKNHTAGGVAGQPRTPAPSSPRLLQRGLPADARLLVCVYIRCMGILT